MPASAPTPKKHSTVVGGSSAERRLACSASRLEEANAPRRASIAADTGTALHHIMETAIREGLNNDQVLAQFAGVRIALDDMDHDIEITLDMLRNKVQPALQFFDLTVPEECEIAIEAQVSMTWPGDRLADMLPITGAHGTCDVVFVGPDFAGIIDWKFGDGHLVKAEGNAQLKFYVCAAIMSGVLPIRDFYEAWIYQPSDKYPDPEQYASSVAFTLQELCDFNSDLHDAITSDPVYTAGPHCHWCAGKITCKAFRNVLHTSAVTDIKGMTADALADAKRMTKAVRKWAEEIDEACLRNAQAGVQLPGWKLETALGDSTWKDPEAAVRALGRMGVASDVRLVSKPISAPQAVKALKALGTPPKKLERFQRTHITRPNAGQKLVPASAEEITGGGLQGLAHALGAMTGVKN